MTAPELNPSDYAATLAELKSEVRAARFTAQRQVNLEVIRLYWRIGRSLSARASSAAWGSKVVTRLADDLRAEFPDMRGFSGRNLRYMRAFADAWPFDSEFGQEPVAQLPWGHITVLLDRLHDQPTRDWYAREAAAHGWSRNVLDHHIRTSAHERLAAAPSNFRTTLTSTDSDLAQQLTKDPYVLDFLALDGSSKERDLEDAMVNRIIATLRELETGFSFVGRQVHFDVDGDDFYVDLLFFHVVQLRYVVVELKTGKFEPAFAGQLGFYVALVDDVLRLPQHANTVGILLVTGKNDAVVRYSLGGAGAPVAVSSYELLPPDVQASLPSEGDITRALGGA
ncbi:putative nuclease of restriction endonuclease-like (RecB) superfamily [Frondihabitans sp. PhB188]|uniref:PDDEXK nuclease domain-containing protein n=1 Tax=Frondihabitans sp. PhB188 TaxID=2485200 RepID=UPI000F95A2F0|nr:PDDEXK nuclease domain-containing protein [Frondihabitans sp. PhB188]ROQ37247.1 putative nuclease of restriction endonuclease-like (RecB) superfamily [Frondihabitans sp. PhB188]